MNTSQRRTSWSAGAFALLLAMPGAETVLVASDTTSAPLFSTFAGPLAVSTYGGGINAGGVIAGSYIDRVQVSHGLIRAVDGSLTFFDAPGAVIFGFNLGTTVTTINAGGDISGIAEILDPAFSFPMSEGFVRLANGTFEEFQIPGNSELNVLSVTGCWLSDGGITAGQYTYGNGGVNGYVRTPGGVVTTFNVAGAGGNTYVKAISAVGVVAGYFAELTGVNHGFTRQPDGTTFVIDVPGAISTMVMGINVAGTATGSYSDASNVSHGFTYSAVKGTFTTFDIVINNVTYTNVFPSAINARGTVVGDLLFRGVIARGFIHPAAGSDTLIQYTSQTFPYGINDGGTITGGTGSPTNSGVGFVRTR